MIQILPCPGCSRQTELPETTSRSATIQCPHCEQTYVVGDVLEREFGSWIVVEDPDASSPAPHPAAEEPAPAVDAVPVADRQDSPAGSDSDEDEVQLQPAAATPAPKTDWSKFEPITHEQFERMRRKSRSPLWSVLQVVLGGVAAVPISLLLIWHVIGTDVGNAGPTVGKYAPWLVPEKFRPYEPPAAIANQERTTKSIPEPGASGFRRFDDVMPPAGDAQAQEAGAGEVSERIEPAPTAVLESSPDETEQEATSVAEESDGNVFDLIRQTQADLSLWENAIAENADLKELALRIYGDFVGLSDAIDALPEGNPVLRLVRDEMKPIGTVVAAQPNVQNIVVQGAKYWREQQTESDAFALALIVEIAAIDEDEAVVRIQSVQASPLEILVPKELAGSLEVSQRLFLLGKVQRPDESAPNNLTFTANYLYEL